VRANGEMTSPVCWLCVTLFHPFSGSMKRKCSWNGWKHAIYHSIGSLVERLSLLFLEKFTVNLSTGASRECLTDSLRSGHWSMMMRSRTCCALEISRVNRTIPTGTKSESVQPEKRVYCLSNSYPERRFNSGCPRQPYHPPKKNKRQIYWLSRSIGTTNSLSLRPKSTTMQRLHDSSVFITCHGFR